MFGIAGLENFHEEAAATLRISALQAAANDLNLFPTLTYASPHVVPILVAPCSLDSTESPEYLTCELKRWLSTHLTTPMTNPIDRVL